MQGKYLDPNILSKVGSLDVVARQVVEGLRIGMHRSPARGISSEFTAYRQYVPGDDVQHVDWKSYARSDRYYIKLYEAETNFVSNLLLDVSSSMTYGSGDITKLEYAKYLAASLAYLIIDQGDSAGVGVFDGELQNYIQPKSSMGVLVDISRELEQVEPKPRTDIGQVLSNFAHRMARRGVAVLSGDCPVIWLRRHAFTPSCVPRRERTASRSLSWMADRLYCWAVATMASSSSRPQRIVHGAVCLSTRSSRSCCSSQPPCFRARQK